MGLPVNGPIVRLILDTSAISGSAVAPGLQDIRKQSQQATSAIADDWKRMAAQIRAEATAGLSNQRELTTERQKLIGILDKEISGLRQRNELTNKELATLKAVTLERERQADAIKRGVSIGITGGTSSALNQVSTQTLLGFERILDSLVNRYLGGAAGAAVRTARDVQYYSTMARGGAGGTGGGSGTGVLGAVGTGGGFLGLSPTSLGVLGGVAAVGTGAAVLTDLAVKGGNLAVELAKLSEKTGLTTAEVIKLRAASSVLDVDADRVTVGFKKFSSELVLASTSDLPGASKSAKEAAALFKTLGVNVKTAAQDPFAAIVQLSKAFASLPDGIVKTTAATILFGRGGMEYLPILDKLGPAMALTAKSAKDLADELVGGKSSVEAVERLRAEMVNFQQEAETLEVALSKRLLPAIIATVNWINEHTPQIANTAKTAASIVAGPEIAAYAAVKSIFGDSSPGRSVDFSKFLDFFPKTGNVNEVRDAEGNMADSAALAAKKAREAAEEFKKTYDAWQRMISSHPTEKENQTRINERHSEIMDQLLGTGKPPDFQSGPLMPIIPLQSVAPQSVLDNLKKVNDEYTKENQSETDKIKAEFDAQLDYWKFIQNQYPDVAKQASDAIVKLKEEEAQKLQAIADKAFEKYKKDADKLFDDLLSGKTKSFTKTLQKDIEDIITQPARKLFDDFVGKMLQGLDQAVNGKTGTGAGSSAHSSATSAAGGILGPILSKIGIGGTAGTFPGSTGLGGSSSTGTVAAGQVGVMTSTMNVMANIVNIGSGMGAPGASPASFSGASFFGNNNPFGGGSSFFGNNNPLGGSTSASTGPLNGQLGPLAGGLLVGGLGVMSGSVTSEAMGAATVATSLANIFGAGNASAIGPTAGSQSLGAQLGQGFGGAGMLASGLSQPGFSGMLSDVAGGAAIGTAIMPGLGTAIGAAAGAVAGLIKGIFSGPSWGQRVHNAMKDQQVIMPPSETFNFASNGSIANTLQTGFSQSGNTFSQYQLPANTPFWANPIHGPLSHLEQQQLASEEAGLIPGQPFLGFPTVNPFTGQGPVGDRRGSSTPNVQVHLNLPGVIDAGSIANSISPHLTKLAALVSTQLYGSASGFGRNVRSAVALV
jgi:hypothetical protein